MNQLDRDKRAIRTVLKQTGGTYMAQILLMAGEDLGAAMRAMVDNGEVTRKEEFVEKIGKDRLVFRLVEDHPANRAGEAQAKAEAFLAHEKATSALLRTLTRPVHAEAQSA